MSNYRYKLLIFSISTLIFFLLSACGNSETGPSRAIEAYITALSTQDTNQVINLSCADWEQSARVEVDSFTAVSSVLQDLSCAKTGQEGDNVLVSCNGKLALDYNGEAQEIDLSGRIYIARQESGEWRMCGYR